MHHALVNTAMNGNLFYAPIGSSPQRVLDIATGTGIWAMNFGMDAALQHGATYSYFYLADQFPSAQVDELSADIRGSH